MRYQASDQNSYYVVGGLLSQQDSHGCLVENLLSWCSSIQHLIRSIMVVVVPEPSQPQNTIYQTVMMDDLTGFQRDVLYVIASLEDEPHPHGLSIKDELEQAYSGEINHGRLYPNLDQLVDMGLVEKGTLDKRTNSYTLTQRGHRELEARRDWENQYVNLDA